MHELLYYIRHRGAREPMIKTTRLLILLIPLALLIVGCQLMNPEADSAPATLIVEPTSLPVATLPAVTPESGSPLTPTQPISQLRVWIPPEIGARTDTALPEMTSQAQSFRATAANLEVIFEQKPIDGQGGILNYLRTGRTVAPSVLPDLIAIPTALLGDAGVQELLVPLDGRIDAGRLTDVYPGVLAGAQQAGQLWGYPFASAGLSHLVFDPSVITGTVPTTWTGFISDTNHTLVLPADSREGAMFGLQFYLAEGGALTNEAGQPDLQVEPLTRALEHISLRRDNLLQSSQLKTLDEAWQYHQLGLSEFAWTRAEHYLSQNPLVSGGPASSRNNGYMAVPGPEGPLVPLTTSYAWAITTSEPVRQALALELMLTLTEPGNLASWSRLSDTIPATRGANSVLAEQDPYFAFVDAEMERVRELPPEASGKVLDALGQAVYQVLTTDTPPAVLANDAVASLRR